MRVPAGPHGWRTACALAALAALAGCAPVPPPAGGGAAAPAAEAAAARPEGFPEAHYRQALARGEAVYRIDPAASLVVVEVLRGGSLARLGHDHVVASRDVDGFVLPREGRADLYVPLAKLTVDEPELRAEAGFDTQPGAAAIAGTRDNMLGPVLRAERHPFAVVAVTAVRHDVAGATVDAAITLNGVTRSVQVPATIAVASDALDVSGRLVLAQSDFAIVPFSVLGGALAVEDRVNVRYRLRARPIAP